MCEGNIYKGDNEGMGERTVAVEQCTAWSLMQGDGGARLTTRKAWKNDVRFIGAAPPPPV